MSKKIHYFEGVKYGSPEYHRLYRLANIEKMREYSREYSKKRYQTHAEQEQARRKRYREANQEKIFAHEVVRKAIKRRNNPLIKLPCQVCGDIERVVAHHDDYSKPLDVIWLCEVDHKARHKIMATL